MATKHALLLHGFLRDKVALSIQGQMFKRVTIHHNFTQGQNPNSLGSNIKFATKQHIYHSSSIPSILNKRACFAPNPFLVLTQSIDQHFLYSQNESTHFCGQARQYCHHALMKWQDLIVPLPQHAQNGKEQVKDVQVESDRSPYVLIVSESFYQVIGIINDVP